MIVSRSGAVSRIAEIVIIESGEHADELVAERVSHEVAESHYRTVVRFAKPGPVLTWETGCVLTAPCRAHLPWLVQPMLMTVSGIEEFEVLADIVRVLASGAVVLPDSVLEERESDVKREEATVREEAEDIQGTVKVIEPADFEFENLLLPNVKHCLIPGLDKFLPDAYWINGLDSHSSSLKERSV